MDRDCELVLYRTAKSWYFAFVSRILSKMVEAIIMASSCSLPVRIRRIFSPESPLEKHSFGIRPSLWAIRELAASTMVCVER